MSEHRATIRPVNIARLVEVVAVCEDAVETIDVIGEVLEASHRRAAEVTAEAKRIGLLEKSTSDPDSYTISRLGEDFLRAVRREDWPRVSSLLSEHSPHYSIARETLKDMGSATDVELLEQLNDQQTPYRFNETGVDVVCDWAERLGDIQRHAFTGRYYVVERKEHLSTEFDSVLLVAYRELDDSVGLDVRQHYVSVPRLRERVCERLRCTRDAFDEALISLVDKNIGKLELTGAPRDTTAKDAVLGIKRIEVTDAGTVVSTVQSTDRVLRGIEYRNKKYYYFVDHRPERQIKPRDPEKNK